MECEREFSAFVRSRSGELQRMAWLLTGDWSSAQDLVLPSLAKTWQRWRSIRRHDMPAACVHRVMVTTFLGWHRRAGVGELALGMAQSQAFRALAALRSNAVWRAAIAGGNR